MKTDSDNCRVTEDDFCKAWCAVWEKKDKNKCLSNQFSGEGSWGDWTEAMLTDKKEAFLKQVKCKLAGTLSREMYYWDEELFRVDVGFVSECNDYMNTDGKYTYPLFFDVLIEHENNMHKIHEEMWKLIFVRSPLKVIVSYGHLKDGVQEKINECIGYLQNANAAFPENEDTRYLFIIGNHVDEKIRWRWASNKQSSLRNLC